MNSPRAVGPWFLGGFVCRFPRGLPKKCRGHPNWPWISQSLGRQLGVAVPCEAVSYRGTELGRNQAQLRSKSSFDSHFLSHPFAFFLMFRVFELRCTLRCALPCAYCSVPSQNAQARWKSPKWKLVVRAGRL